MYTRLIQILLLALIAIIMLDGLPGLGASIINAIPGAGHSSPYNLIFWISRSCKTPLSGKRQILVLLI